MITVPVRCPHCQATYQVPDSVLGREFICPSCRQSFVPSAEVEGSSRRTSPWWWLSDAASGASGAATVAELSPAPAPESDLDTWRPGDVILDLYEVREVFTSGGRGLVYRVHHRGWDMDLAVKCPRP